MASEIRETRTAILEATCRLLEEKLGQNVRLEDIAKAAGISRQAVHLHFNSRTDLRVAATRHIDELRRREDRLAPSRKPPPAWKAWSAIANSGRITFQRYTAWPKRC